MLDLQIADFSNPVHASAVVYLLNEYAKDDMGGGEPLSASTQANLVKEMAKRPAIHVVLAFVSGKPAGLINCIEGFSTFACKPSFWRNTEAKASAANSFKKPKRLPSLWAVANSPWKSWKATNSRKPPTSPMALRATS